ncbi:LEAF RUST 10 DISEASE-RESISTANCE LOCUS RECEPTOR-LIKE PROTEIN KINASE-like 2.5 [Neltuma alba]|uniref:LEAF RUST 10 DISEASE-RESISTANCE LOCUS RECEPTOR-LIKE PROTEIN KINASE-like 2.5 n=1 Tax=Neltuma alba TaxID=207710 RepID=UPI0010A41827|nr:LEAF RUST 10 DISEASE-RESISTANCE LOCUS RECEPTOR-LIKE PROTEIN KINASE-like 2.5 [Prosopis alba]
MTKSFKDKLGQGGYSSVYKGKLLDGRPVAVKLLKASRENGEDFINEVASISGTSHVNVATLLGFCFEGKKKALIYEFMSNGSLDKFIYNNAEKTSLWLTSENLYQIAIGIARGLEYLHRGCNTRILHFDIKPHNILLDENFCPKISDFGLAKLCPKKESTISISEARGTIGYLAPEVWNRNIGGVSNKSDVYSYGMMLLDMVGGRKNMNVETNCSTEKYFPDYIYVQLEQDSNLGYNGANNAGENDIAKRMTIVALWCIQTFPSQRPTMSRVIEMLERRWDLLEMPPKPIMPSLPRLELESSITTTTTTTEILGFQSASHMLLEEH